MKVNIELRNYAKSINNVTAEWDDCFICIHVIIGKEMTFEQIAEVCRVCNGIFRNGGVLIVPVNKVWGFEICSEQ